MSAPPPEDREDPSREDPGPQPGPEGGWFPAPVYRELDPEPLPPDELAPVEPPEPEPIPPTPPPPVGMGIREFMEKRENPTPDELEDEAERAHVPARRPGPLGKVVSIAARLAVLGFLLIPAFSFLYIALNRMTSPFEHEWLEGEVAIYSVRWQEQRSLGHLYPPYEKGDYVPHLYPPLYQIVVAELQGIVGGNMLAVGRFVSLMATLALMAAVVFIVRDLTRSWFAGIAGALLYPAFFKVGGFWFDLNRVDSFAYAMAMWATWFILRRRGGIPSLILGVALMVAAHFSKQTAVFLPFLALLLRLAISMAQLASQAEIVRVFSLRSEPFRRPAAILFLAAPCIFLLVVVGYFVARGNLGDVGFYLYNVGRSHPIFFTTIATEGYQELWQYFLFLPWLPAAALWASATFRRWKPWWTAPLALLLGAAVTSLVGRWLMSQSGEAAAQPSSPSSLGALLFVCATWPAMIKWAVAATMGGLALWVVRWLQYGAFPRGAAWLGALLVAQFVAAVTKVKLGGYVNNYFPLFAVEAVVFGVAVAWLFRALERPMRSFGSVLAAIAVLAVLLPTWYGTREPAQKWAKDKHPWASAEVTTRRPTQLATMPAWASDGLISREPDPRVEPVDGETAPLVTWGRQLPNPRSAKWWPMMIERLRELEADGGVYLPHQNYYGHLAGIPIRPSADSIRDVNYMGKMTPQPLIDRLKRKDFKYIVLTAEVQHDWLPPDMKSAIQANYRSGGQLVPNVPWDAYLPLTGATPRPLLIYQAK